MDKLSNAATQMAAAYDDDPYVRGWLEGYAARKQEERKEVTQE